MVVPVSAKEEAGEDGEQGRDSAQRGENIKHIRHNIKWLSQPNAISPTAATRGVGLSDLLPVKGQAAGQPGWHAGIMTVQQVLNEQFKLAGIRQDGYKRNVRRLRLESRCRKFVHRLMIPDPCASFFHFTDPLPSRWPEALLPSRN